ncbi:MAG TPA: NAD-dependent epimerase/dehydratase family protein [Gemmatimonadota bacterium]|nr:NAD-dependent epimerase/dehydratase family protein [Gemmatimonadota bacterium]
MTTDAPTLITGASGFVGRALCRHLIQRGHRVRAFVRDPTSVVTLADRSLEIVAGDVLDAESLERASRGCAGVFHLAAVTTWTPNPRGPLWSVNVEGTRNVARSAAAAGMQRFVLASSVGVYGGRPPPLADETTTPNPDTAYRESKLAAEEAVRSIALNEGLEHVIARLATVFGPGSDRWLAWVRTIAAGRFRMIGRGRNHLHEVHVADVVDGMERCMITSGISGKSYILASAEPVELGRVVESIADELGIALPSLRWPGGPFRALRLAEAGLRNRLNREPSLTQRYNLFLEDRRFSIARARTELGYNPRIDLLDGLTREARRFRDCGRLR